MADFRPADDISIPDDEPLYIRIFPSADALIYLPDENRFRPNSGTVKRKNKNEPISMDLGSLCTPEQTRDRGTNGNFHVATLTAGKLRDLGFRIRRDPIQDQNSAHAIVIGSRKNDDGDQNGGLTENESSKLARAARVIINTNQ